jgi:hypothetical protein
MTPAMRASFHNQTPTGIEAEVPTYRYRGWVGRWQQRQEWSVPVTDRGTLHNLWQIAADQIERGGYSADERVQVMPA